MLGATVYVSLTRSKAPLLAELAAAARAHGALLHLFHDAEYSRAALSLSSASPAALANGCAAVAATAVAQVDLAAHGAEAAHPAVGVVDHITCWPRGPEAVAGAGAVATRMRALGVPVLLYGDAHAEGRPLADCRRPLNYFESAVALPPTVEGMAVSPKVGVCCVGAGPMVTNFNVELEPGLAPAAARDVARAVSTRRGGPLAGIESLALPHAGTFEVALNLVGEDQPTKAQAYAAVAEAAESHGGAVAAAWTIGLDMEEATRRHATETAALDALVDGEAARATVRFVP